MIVGIYLKFKNFTISADKEIMKLILFLISITAILPLTVFAQRERFSDQKEKNVKIGDGTTRVQVDISNSVINYNDPAALRTARMTYLSTIKVESVKAASGGRLKTQSSDAYLFLSPEQRSLATQK